MFSYFEPNFIEKFLWKVFFQILAKIEMTRNKKNQLFGRHFETVQHFQYFFAELWFFIAHTYMVQNIIAKFGWENGFLRLGPLGPPPLGHQGSKSTLVT